MKTVLINKTYTCKMMMYIVAVICVIILILYSKFTRCYSYWEEKGVKGPKPVLLVGNLGTILTKKESMGMYLDRLYNEYAEEKYFGIYQGTTPVLVLKDPDAIKRVLIKDFSAFIDRGFGSGNDPITKNIATEDGDSWKILRHNFSPIFTTGKLKQMMPLINKSAKEYMQYVDRLIEQKPEQDICKINMKYTLKVLTLVAFGLDTEVFTEEKCKFVEMADKILMLTLKRIITEILRSYVPTLINALRIQLVDPEVKAFFLNFVRKTIDERKGEAKLRNDMMDFMIEMMEKKVLRKNRDDVTMVMEVTEEVIAAQALLFYAAGFETSSGVMSYLLYELAINPGIQDNCYAEIKDVINRYDGEITYEALSELKYLKMSLDEALRKHSIVYKIQRKAVNSYAIDSNLTLDKGTIVMIPVYSLQLDPKYYPNPEVFDPERFAPENKGNIREGTYLPFGDGPRNCIGLRFAKIEAILGVASFLNKYRVLPCEKTVTEIRFDPKCLTQVCKDGLWMRIEKR